MENKQMREKILKLPKWFVVLTAVLAGAGLLVVIHASSFLLQVLPELPGYTEQMISELLAGIYAFAVLAWFGYAGILKEKGAGFLRSFYIGGFLVGYCIYMLVAQFYLQMMNTQRSLQPLPLILVFTATMFLVGWAEELVFRGVILNLLLDCFSKTQKGIVGAILLDGILFGAVHLTNIFSGVSILSACVQAVTAGLLGILFAAVYARSRNIWVVIIAHTLTDFASLMSGGIFGNGGVIEGINQLSYVNLLAVPILLIPCLILLRKSKRKEMELRANGIEPDETVKMADNIAVMSLVLGVLGIIFGMMGYGLGIGIVGILGSIISKKIKPAGNGLATAGLVTSIVGVVIAVFAVVLFSAVFALTGGAFGGMEAF